MPCSSSIGEFANYDADAHQEIRRLSERISELETNTNSTKEAAEEQTQNTLQALKTECDSLTYENDLLREIVLKAYSEGKIDIDDGLAHKINVDQMNHRQEDLDRLESVFIESKDSDKLGKVWSADVQYPLEPQLGFDPNEF